MNESQYKSAKGVVPALIGKLNQALPEAWVEFILSYAKVISGSLGRLVFSLIYFIALANSLKISDFGLFVTCSATGVVLSRVVAMGFYSPLFRAAAMRPRLIGLYTGGYILATIVSLPIVCLAAIAIYYMFFIQEMSVFIFAIIIVTEALIWRMAEVTIIVNNGMGDYGRGSVLTILSTFLRALAALSFAAINHYTLEYWAILYLSANCIVLAISLIFFYPRKRLRFHIPIYMRRMRDSLAVSSAEVLFYIQMELDKLLVLALGGAHFAGLYAIIMRLVDLTAIPIRSFNLMLIRSMMRNQTDMSNTRQRIVIELAIFAISTLGFLTLTTILYIFPNALGENVAAVTSIVIIAMFIPAFRNLTEYQGELLYARGQTVIRTFNLAILGTTKAGLLVAVFAMSNGMQQFIFMLNGVFAILYCLSASLTYWAMKRPSRAM